ncbi:MAG: hypothetical protein HY719_12710, partial [Planctomycetes bacterium]|nr:hypothetical protein [Planctomycetota bacterium]
MRPSVALRLLVAFLASAAALPLALAGCGAGAAGERGAAAGAEPARVSV